MKITLNISPDSYAEVQEAAKERELTAAAWIRQAILSYLRTHKSNKPKHVKKHDITWPSGYPKNTKCFHCKSACHDPGTAHGYEKHEIGEHELAYAAAHPCEVPHGS